VCIARAAPSWLLATDGDVEACANLRHNLERNGVRVASHTGRLSPPAEPATGAADGEGGAGGAGSSGAAAVVRCVPLVWETASLEELREFKAEVVVGADLLYAPENIAPLCRVVRALLEGNPGKCEALVVQSDPSLAAGCAVLK